MYTLQSTLLKILKNVLFFAKYNLVTLLWVLLLREHNGDVTIQVSRGS